jgi:hypothetical protein
MYYESILYVKNPFLVAGRHVFECKIDNSEGTDTHTIDTNVPVYNVTEITHEGSTSEGDTLVLTCAVTLPEKLKDLLPFVNIEWEGPPEVSMAPTNMVYVGDTLDIECGLSRTLTFDPLKTGHSGLYRCLVSISKRELVQFFERELRHTVAVKTQALFQIQFGPVTHYSTWFSPDIARTLESNLKMEMVDAINKRSNSGFHEGLIDLGEMSCHCSEKECCANTAVYRSIIHKAFVFPYRYFEP